MKVIVADDSRVIRTIIEKTLRTLGFEAITHAGNGQEVLDLLETGEGYDLILLDWNMPILSGFEVLTQIRNSHEAIPVLMVSTESEDEKVAAALNAGARGYLAKPFTPEELAAAVWKVTGKRKVLE